MTTKKLFVIALIFLILASGSLFIYNFFLKERGGPAPRGDHPFEQTFNLKVKPISLEKAFAPAIGENNQTVKYYLRNNGYVFESAFDGSGLEQISAANLRGLTNIVWSPDKTKVISFFDKAGSIEKYFYDYKTRQTVALNRNIKNIAWSPDSQKIAYQYESADGQSNNISLANPDGSAWRNILQTRLRDLIIEWPTPNKISLRSKPSGLTQGFLYSLDPQSGSFNRVLADLYGFSAKWSPDGQKILYQATNQKGKDLKLYMAAADGSQSKELPIVTLTEKCVWSGDSQTIFCAVPQKISENAVWPDDWLLDRLTLNDDFYIIDLTTNQKTKIAESSSEQSFDAQEMLLSPNEDYLFFINRKDGLLYSVQLELK